MPKYINADNLIECFNSIHPDSQLMYASTFADFVREMPKEDVEPIVHGRWILDRRMADGGLFKCSVCGRYFEATSFNRIENAPYCNCGAKMDLKD